MARNSNREYNSRSSLSKKWYNEYFRKETIKYLKNKSEKDIKTFSAPEYVKCELKYIAQEHQRESNYIHEIFHSDINDLNYEYLIANNMLTLVEMDTGINNMFKTKKKTNFLRYINYLHFILKV